MRKIKPSFGFGLFLSHEKPNFFEFFGINTAKDIKNHLQTADEYAIIKRAIANNSRRKGDSMDRTVCFTGHRHIPDEDYPVLFDTLFSVIEQQIALGAVTFLAGGALGFDTMAALAVLSLRKRYPHVRLELILPCPSQTRGWSKGDTVLYEQIKEQADAVHYVSTGYYKGVLQQRNRALVEKADVCVAYLRNSNGGGTAYTASLALKNGLDLINLQDLIKK